tara:strand:- start:108 stop:749 length:642 start_codon:yes stop_codon:yes gene_type:complete
MFTGIIESLGVINNIEKTDSGLEFAIFSEKKLFEQVNIGDSVSINGVCLTVVNKKNSKDKNLLFFDIVNETLDKTNLGLFKKEEKVNLETSLKFGSGLDGHIVQGHIDTTGLIVNNQLNEDNNWVLEIMIEKKWLKYCIKKGSITIDGISLTIANINDDYANNNGCISTSIIPHTLENTNLKFKKTNDTVNVETDFLGKYVERILQPRMEKYE